MRSERRCLRVGRGTSTLEFVVVLPGPSAEAAHTKVRTLMEVAAEAGREICGEDLLSMSVGAAFHPEDGNEAEQLLAEADRRMYKAKQRLAQAADSWKTQPTTVS